MVCKPSQIAVSRASAAIARSLILHELSMSLQAGKIDGMLDSHA